MTATSLSAARATLSAVIVVALLTACAERSASDALNSTPISAVPARNLAALSDASSWRGDIPCADCAGIRTTITLYPDGSYRREGAYLGTNGGGDTIAAEFGRWTHARNATRVRLHGSMEVPMLYAFDSDGALRMLDRLGHDMVSNTNYRLAPIGETIALTHPSRITGAFTYLADAASFVECRSGLQYPVSMSAEFPTLQRVYADAGGNGQPQIVRLGAHLDNRPAVEGNGTMLALMVDSVHSINPNDGCVALRTQDSVAANEWRLIALESADGEPITVGDSTEAAFAWDRDDTRLTGSGGCNRFSASSVVRGTTLVGAAAAATKRFCNEPGVMDIEHRFFELLANDIALRFDADTLVWSHGPRDVARFVRHSASAGN